MNFYGFDKKKRPFYKQIFDRLPPLLKKSFKQSYTREFIYEKEPNKDYLLRLLFSFHWAAYIVKNHPSSKELFLRRDMVYERQTNSQTERDNQFHEIKALSFAINYMKTLEEHARNRSKIASFIDGVIELWHRSGREKRM